MRVALRSAAFLLLLSSAAACHKVQARTPSAPPRVLTLDIPTPPARVTIPVELPEAGPPATPPAMVDVPAPTRPEAPSTSRPTPPPAPSTATAGAPAPVLQTTRDTGSQERKAQSLLGEAQWNLDNVNYRDLSPQAKAQYDSATSFIKNGKLALQNKNYMYAEQLATKAAAVARALRQ